MIKWLKCDKQLSTWQPTTRQPGHKEQKKKKRTKIQGKIKEQAGEWENHWRLTGGGATKKSQTSLEGTDRRTDRVTVSYGLDIRWHAFHLSVDFANCAPLSCPPRTFPVVTSAVGYTTWPERQEYAAKSQKISKQNERLCRKQSNRNKIQIEKREKLESCWEKRNNFSLRSWKPGWQSGGELRFLFPKLFHVTCI